MGRKGKLRTDWPARFGRVAQPIPRTSRARILLHAVSVGEVNAIRLLVDALAADASNPEVVIATTTDTGFARATALIKSELDVSFGFSGNRGPAIVNAPSVPVLVSPIEPGTSSGPNGSYLTT